MTACYLQAFESTIETMSSNQISKTINQDLNMSREIELLYDIYNLVVQLNLKSEVGLIGYLRYFLISLEVSQLSPIMR